MTADERHDHDRPRAELELENPKAELRDTAEAILARELFESAPQAPPRLHTRGWRTRGRR